MRHDGRRARGWLLEILISVLCLAVAGCGRDAATPSTAAKPATVTAPVKEAQLTTVTLTEDAERRLAVKTEPANERARAPYPDGWR